MCLASSQHSAASSQQPVAVGVVGVVGVVVVVDVVAAVVVAVVIGSRGSRIDLGLVGLLPSEGLRGFSHTSAQLSVLEYPCSSPALNGRASP